MLMREDALANETPSEQRPETVEAHASPLLDPARPITNRFLLVNVAARRAKQVHNCAFRRLRDEDLATLDSPKAKRLAMEEIARGLVPYDMPPWNAAEVEPLILLPGNALLAGYATRASSDPEAESIAPHEGTRVG
jgi:DNA-directed RNA polymerase omega subunit